MTERQGHVDYPNLQRPELVGVTATSRLPNGDPARGYKERAAASAIQSTAALSSARAAMTPGTATPPDRTIAIARAT